MSANYMSVGELIDTLSKYPPTMSVVVLRHPDYRVAADYEYDGVEHVEPMHVKEYNDVYIKDEAMFPENVVLVLSATPLDDEEEDYNEQ